VSVGADGVDVVHTAADADGNRLPPLIVLDRLAAFLEEHGFASDLSRVERIGVRGGSNFSFLLECGSGDRYVLRRPPRPPLPPSAHDMVREARLQLALAQQGVRVPPILAVCEDEDVLGVPFYVMPFLEGYPITDPLPPALPAGEAVRHALGLELVDTLAEIHAVNVHTPDLEPFIRSGDYAERQVRRWTQLWGVNQTRELPVPELARRMALAIPAPQPLAVVHGDYRLGNVMAAGEPPRIVAVLDWEMGAIGDARADVGYLVATYEEPPGFPTPAELVARYEERTGRSLERLAWFEALALWKSSVFCEAIYGRYVRGELGEAPRAERFGELVPTMVERAFAALARDVAES
jgi:aminoglycoside phosphotransferase (APT) family kinase protein